MYTKGIMSMLESTGTDLMEKCYCNWQVKYSWKTSVYIMPATKCYCNNVSFTDKRFKPKLADADVVIVAVGVAKFIHGIKFEQ